MHPSLGPGQILFRRYRIVRELGRGGMGTVLLAQDVVLGIPVALKLVPDRLLSGAETMNDLRREVLRGMALSHTNIVRTHTFEFDGSRAGVVMEYIDGDTLSARKEQQPGRCFDAAQLLPWLRPLCDALDYAHREARIVHRDLKPSNVMLTREGRVKVADFGIAASLADTLSRGTTADSVSGTPSYMSPQQARGKKSTHLDDVYSLGATLYDLLTSKPPFFRGPPSTILLQVLEERPITMAERRLELEIAGKPPIPSGWEAVIAACLEKDPSKRPQSCLEVFTRLRSAHPNEYRPKPLGPAKPAREPQANTPIAVPAQKLALSSAGENQLIGAEAPTVTDARAPRRRSRWLLVVPLVLAASALIAVRPFTRPHPIAQASSPEPVTPRPESSPTPTPPPTPVPRTWRQIVEEGRTLRDHGDLAAAITKFREAAVMEPQNAEPLSESALTFERMNLRDKAAEQWRRIIELGPSAGAFFVAAQEHLKPPATPSPAPPPPEPPVSSLDPNAILGAAQVTVQKGSGPEDPTTIRVPIRAKRGVRVAPNDVDVHVLLYDTINGTSPIQTNLNVSYRWENPPVTWTTHNPETLVVNGKPSGPALKGDPDRRYYGYIVRVYHKGELQDVQSEPASLKSVYHAPTKLPVETPRADGTGPFTNFAGPENCSKESPYTNSLGMKFVPSGNEGVLLCQWETRLQDFQQFITQSGYSMEKGAPAYTLEKDRWRQSGGAWNSPRLFVEQTPTHPVVCVSWDDAHAFCAWLTESERAAGKLTAKQAYRLPTDHEWSVAAGLGDAENAMLSPEKKDAKIRDVYPWGTQWPPPPGAGNFAGAESRVGPAEKLRNFMFLREYRDPFPCTAPVGSSERNRFDLYDLAGNVWEWCEDQYRASDPARVLRGGSWFSGEKSDLLSARRLYVNPSVRRSSYGFRCALSVK